MRALDHLLGLAAVAVLTCGLSGSLGGERAFAESQRVAASGSARRIVAVYRVEIAGFNLGNFRLTANFRGSNYEMRGEARFSILDGLIYEWQGTTLSRGKVTRSGPKPAMYALSYRGGKKVEQLLERAKAQDKEIQNLKDRLAGGSSGDLSDNAVNVGDIK